MTLSQAQCDIDIAKDSWVDQFMLTPLTPFPVPAGETQTAYPASIDFGWQPVTGARAYHVQVARGSDSVVNDHVSTSYLHGVHLPSGSYQWRVATDQSAAHLVSPWSGWHSFTVT